VKVTCAAVARYWPLPPMAAARTAVPIPLI
jgi:hypothetical protein